MTQPVRRNERPGVKRLKKREAENNRLKTLLAGSMLENEVTHEAVTIVRKRAMRGHVLMRILARVASLRGLPKAIRTDNGNEFCGWAMLNWAHWRGVKRFLITWQAQSECLY